MVQASARAVRAGFHRQHYGHPFAGLLDAVLVEEPTEYPCEGAITTRQAEAAWVWMARDLAPDLITVDPEEGGPTAAAFEAVVPQLLSRARDALAAAKSGTEAQRTLKMQLGGDDGWNRLPTVLTALRVHPLLEKARGFGRAANGIADEASMALALQSLPLQEPAVSALIMQAVVGHVAAPSRLVLAAIRITGGGSETSLQRAGFGPLVEAILSHAQNQIPPLGPSGVYADMDLACRSIDRFHRLMRGLAAYVEFTRGSRWATAMAGITRSMSNRVAPKLRDVLADLNRALHRREGMDRIDGDHILMALNGMYLLAAVRDSRDSLGVNAVFDTVWAQTGQALEIHLDRHLSQLRAEPGNELVAQRLDAALKMAEIRFGQEFADTMRRARDAAERRA